VQFSLILGLVVVILAIAAPRNALRCNGKHG